MLRNLLFSIACSGLLASTAAAQDPIHFEGSVPEGPNTFFFLDFEVPEGIAEIEVVHTHIPEDTPNVLDWGVDDPNGSRGWGGSNSENAVIGEEAASRSYIPGEIPAGTWRVTVGKARLVEGEPAGYAVDIFLRETAELPPQPREPYQDPGSLNPEARWYAGDFHVHTRESGDVRTTLVIDEALDVAEEQGLDFVMLSEHNTNSGFTLYADAQARHPDLLIFPGQEFTTYEGHANAIGALDNVVYTVDTDGYTIEDAIDAFHEQGALFSISHPSNPIPDCRGCSWDFVVDPALIDGVEVQTAILRGLIFWEDLIEAGSRATAVGGSDDHRAGKDLGAVETVIGTPTTMVFADELSVEAIFEGVRSGRTAVKLFGPDGPMVDTTLSGDRDGNTVTADTAILRAVVTGGDGLRLQVIKNRETMRTVTVDGGPFTHEVEVTAPEEGEDRYRHQVLLGPNPQTITSYVWLKKGEPGPDGGVPDGGVPDGGAP
ncbi:MAG: CehA/McbA family metallohydrolase, partial [Polyangiales bacterium]